ncbi:hypothetical protein [Actinomadura sp. 6K520]|uniref:hypothetical protein n=1 Tax=Actinomadura sp. 6K520 TaxID=2530364 RepID=UPI001A9F4E1D|nr:hypothetical protein [Actinomadura sp. 6K520]
MMQGLLDELRRVLDAGDPASLLAGVDRLTTAVLAHLDHEEEKLVPLLDAVELQGRALRAGRARGSAGGRGR